MALFSRFAILASTLMSTMLPVSYSQSQDVGRIDRNQGIRSPAEKGSVTSDGPLRVHPENTRYFTADGRTAVLLTGSHTWDNLVDMDSSNPPVPFDYIEHFDWLQNQNLNFIRLWSWELMTWDTRGNKEKNARLLRVAPHPWKRIGPALASDGGPRFDLKQLDDDYFARLRTRVKAAQDRDIYVAIMLFNSVFDQWLEEPSVSSREQRQRN